jgi:hypothetical protein
MAVTVGDVDRVVPADRPEAELFRGSLRDEPVRDSMSSDQQGGDTEETDWYAGESTPVSDPEGWYADHEVARLGDGSDITVDLPVVYEHPERDRGHTQPTIEEITHRLGQLEGIISGLRTLESPPERDCYTSEQEELLARIERLEGVLATLPVHVSTPERDWYNSVEEEIVIRLGRLEDVISVLPSHQVAQPQWYPRSEFDDFMAGRLEDEADRYFLGEFGGAPEIGEYGTY